MAKSNRRFLVTAVLSFVLALSAVLSGCSGSTGEEWTITLDYNDGVSRNELIYVEKSKSAQLPEDRVRTGYTFTGWTTQDGTAVENPYTPTGDVTLVANWTTGNYTVTFHANCDGGEDTTQEIPAGTFVSAPPTPEHEGYTFRYWSVTPDGSAVDFANYIILGDYKFYAIWRDSSQNLYTVTFRSGVYDGAGGEKTVEVLQGDPVRQSNAPKNLLRGGYTLAGWTTDVPEGEDWTLDSSGAKGPELISLPYKPTEDLTLYAVWSVEQYTAVFNANYTDSPYQYGVFHSEKLMGNESVKAPEEEPVRENYSFDGWYTLERGGDKVDFSQNINLTSNAGYYAHWKHDPMATTTFQAEYTQFDPTVEHWGYSGSSFGAKCIVKDAGAVGAVSKDDYPTNSKLLSGNGYYVSGQYEIGNTIRFEIISSQDTTATLVANLAMEGSALTISNTGENSTIVTVNGTEIAYSFDIGLVFSEYSFGKVSLKEGLNVIEFKVNNSNTVMGGTFKAVSFMTDYIKLTGSSATFTWSPIYDNLEVVG